mmetsp:Transcript_159240/g.305502  ORF Transcript_159240/g.305502 Transcript_159240/m.305502 type:complete len:230 (+) Transcript_159240:84-773(+)
MPSYKFMYFDGQAAGERTRYIFALAKVPYTDFRYPVTGDRAEFRKDQAEGKLAISLGKVPILEVDGRRIAQSKAIERYLAKAFGMMGSDPFEEALVDMLCEHDRDLKDLYRKLDGLPEKERQPAREKWFTQELPTMLAKIDLAVPSGPGPFLVGSRLSLADIAFFVTISEWLVLYSPFADDRKVAWHSTTLASACKNSPRLAASIEAMMRLPEVEAWRAKRSGPPGSRL